MSNNPTRMPKVGTSLKSVNGVNIVSNIITRAEPRDGLAWMFRSLLPPDYGIDGTIEVLDHSSAQGSIATGKMLSVQVKAGASYFGIEEKNNWIIYIRKETVNYWREHSLPVIIILVDTDNEVCYWVRGDTTHTEVQENYKIVVPKRNRLNFDARDELLEIANTVSKFGSKLAGLSNYTSIMRNIEEGEVVRLWARRDESADTYAKIFIGDDIQGGKVELFWQSETAGDDLRELLPWADLIPDDTANTDYEAYLEEEGMWDEEDGEYRIYSDVTFDDWRSSLSTPDGFVMANGTTLPDGSQRYEYNWQIELNDLGIGFLRVLDYLAE